MKAPERFLKKLDAVYNRLLGLDRQYFCLYLWGNLSQYGLESQDVWPLVWMIWIYTEVYKGNSPDS